MGPACLSDHCLAGCGIQWNRLVHHFICRNRRLAAFTSVFLNFSVVLTRHENTQNIFPALLLTSVSPEHPLLLPARFPINRV